MQLREIEIGRKLTRGDVGRILKIAMPVRSRISPNKVQQAVRFLRIRRNGGFIISPAPDGQWWVGSKRRTPQELVQLAESRGLTAGASSKIG